MRASKQPVELLRTCFLAPQLKEIEEMRDKSEQHDAAIVWPNVAWIASLHAGALIGLHYALFEARAATIVWMLVVNAYACSSITGGAHRLWCHRAYKANFGVRLLWAIGTTISVQAHFITSKCLDQLDAHERTQNVTNWSRNDRCHDKWTESDADPQNIKRGFFFAHAGWLMCRKHPKVKEMGKKVDISDLESDPILAFQRRYFSLLVPLTFLVLTVVPVYFWRERTIVAFFVAAVLRLAIQLHIAWSINSLAHLWGFKPFDTKITAVDNFVVAVVTNGEGWHNYHHTFPEDYRASEYAWTANLTCCLIDFFAWNGWVWDRKQMSKEAVDRQKSQKGDHSRQFFASSD